MVKCFSWYFSKTLNLLLISINILAAKCGIKLPCNKGCCNCWLKASRNQFVPYFTPSETHNTYADIYRCNKNEQQDLTATNTLNKATFFSWTSQMTHECCIWFKMLLRGVTSTTLCGLTKANFTRVGFTLKHLKRVPENLQQRETNYGKPHCTAI